MREERDTRCAAAGNCYHKNTLTNNTGGRVPAWWMSKSILKKSSCLRTAVSFQYYCSHLLPCSSLLPSLWWWLPAPQHSWQKKLDRWSINNFNVVSKANWNHHRYFWQFQISAQKRGSSLIRVCTSCECVLTSSEGKQWHQLPEL